MTQEITQDTIRALSGGQLELVDGWVQEEKRTRIQTRKQETLAKIRELARSIEVGVKIEGSRGRPPKIPGRASMPANARSKTTKA